MSDISGSQADDNAVVAQPGQVGVAPAAPAAVVDAIAPSVRKYAKGETWSGAEKPSDDVLADPSATSWWKGKAGKFTVRKRRAKFASLDVVLASVERLSPSDQCTVFDRLGPICDRHRKELEVLEYLRSQKVSKETLKKYMGPEKKSRKASSSEKKTASAPTASTTAERAS